MKFSAVFLVACAAALVSAETNAERMARGLAPNAPARRATPVDSKDATFFSLSFSLTVLFSVTSRQAWQALWWWWQHLLQR